MGTLASLCTPTSWNHPSSNAWTERGPGIYRARTGERREPRITVWLAPAEWAMVLSAAARAGMAPGAYPPQAPPDAAQYRALTPPGERRPIEGALMPSPPHGSPHRPQ